MQMGERLAKEIRKFIEEEVVERKVRVNMVGHSMGGLILRAALQYLQEYSGNLGTFMSFGSPHLGYLHGTKTTVKTGLWFFKSWNKTLSL